MKAILVILGIILSTAMTNASLDGKKPSQEKLSNLEKMKLELKHLSSKKDKSPGLKNNINYLKREISF